MNREKIEERDQRLIRKFREIVKNKEKKPREKEPVRLTRKLWLPLVFTGLVLVGLLVSREQPATMVLNNSNPASGNAFENNAPPGVGKIIVQPEKEEVSREMAEKPSEALLDTDPSAGSKATLPVIPTEQPRTSSRVQVYEIVSCSSVSKKQYVSPRTIFSLKDEPTPVIWMTVLSDNPPFTLTHVYYINGQKYCEVPLKIRYRRMRTWSNVAVTHLNHVGRWRVEVVTDSGEKLAQTEFTVVE